MHDDYRLPSIDAAEALARHHAGALRLVDVRAPAARAASGQGFGGIDWVDPFSLDHRHPILGTDTPVAFFCVHGHQVSRFACALGRLHRRETVYVTGGFEALAAAGAPIGTLVGTLDGTLGGANR